MANKDVFELLSEETEHEELTRRFPPLSQSELRDIAEKCEEKLNTDNSENADTVDGVEHYSAAKWYRKPAFSLAASAILAAAVGGALIYGIDRGLPEQRTDIVTETENVTNVENSTENVSENNTEIPADETAEPVTVGDGLIVSDIVFPPCYPNYEYEPEKDDLARTKGLWEISGGVGAYYIVMDGCGGYSEWERTGELIGEGTVFCETVEKGDTTAVRYSISNGECFYFFDNKRFYMGEDSYGGAEYTIFSRDADINARPVEDCHETLDRTEGLWKCTGDAVDKWIYMNGKGELYTMDENWQRRWSGYVGAVRYAGRVDVIDDMGELQYYVVHCDKSWFGNFRIVDDTLIFSRIDDSYSDLPEYSRVTQESDLDE